VKKFIILALSVNALYANPEDNHHDIIQSHREKSTVMTDVITVEHVLEHVKKVYSFGEQLFIDVQGNPKSHVFAALGGAFLGIFVYKRFSGIGRANRKLDKILKILKADGKADSSKKIVIA
jgi:hypothetical protein